jgi:UDP-N-acetylmuramate dehydrogenase
MLAKMQRDYSLKTCNTLAVPSVADYFIACHSVDEIQDALRWAKAKTLPVHILGGGSNVLLAENISGLIIKPELLGKSIRLENEYAMVSAAAGEDWHQFVLWCCENHVYGLENLALIPGSVGAAPVQNIGAYGVELVEFVDSVKVLDQRTLSVQTLSAKECEFSYRDSIFKSDRGKPFIILELHLKLATQFSPRLTYKGLDTFTEAQRVSAISVAHAIADLRRSKLPDPNRLPNAGSFFKNPVITNEVFEKLAARYPDIPSYSVNNNCKKIPAAWLIDRLGWKDRVINHVGVHREQALVLINPKERPLADIRIFSEELKADVYRHFDIELEIEPRLIE